MLELDELDELHVVAGQAEQLRPGRVGDLGGEALAEHAVAQERRERRVVELGEQLVLAAGHSEDHLRLPLDRLRERRVGGRVARVQADDEVGAVEAVRAGDVADGEAEALGAEAVRERGALRDDVLLQVEPEHVDAPPVPLDEQVVQREREVRAPAAEVDDAQRVALGQGRQHVLDQLEEAIHLAVLVVALRAHRARRRHHPELDEERHRLALGEDALLAAVVRLVGVRARRRPLEHAGAAAAGEHLEVDVAARAAGPAGTRRGAARPAARASARA